MRAIWASAAVLMAAFGAAPAFAQPVQKELSPDPFSALVGRRAPAEKRELRREPVERYVVAAQERIFLFQSGEREGRLKFLCGDRDVSVDCAIDPETPAEEIYLLTPARGSRGDVVWRDPRGETMLRISSYGGATIFQPGDLQGRAAAKSFGEDPSLSLPPVSIERARARAQRATAIVSARIGAPIVFEIGEPVPDAEGGAAVLADAVARVAKGVDAVGSDDTGAKAISGGISQIEFRAGDKPAISLKNRVLEVDYNPALDVAGRPASAEIERFLENSL